MDVTTVEEGGVVEVGCGTLVVVPGAPPVEEEFGVVVGDEVC